jgi:hypothetical protein
MNISVARVSIISIQTATKKRIGKNKKCDLKERCKGTKLIQGKDYLYLVGNGGQAHTIWGCHPCAKKFLRVASVAYAKRAAHMLHMLTEITAKDYAKNPTTIDMHRAKSDPYQEEE